MAAQGGTIRAIFSDMDGTLLNQKHRISDYTASVLNRLKAAGVRFILCTGRPHPDVFATIRKCGLQPDYVITSNGARTYDGNFKLLRRHDMDPVLVEELTQLRGLSGTTRSSDADSAADPLRAAVMQSAFVSNFYQDDRWVTNEAIPEAVAAFDEALTLVDMGERLHTLKAKDLTGVQHFWFQTTPTGTPDDLQPIRAFMRERYVEPGRITLTSSAPIVVEVMPPGVTKGVAVRDVTELLGLRLEQIAAFGDGENDLSMLELAGKPFVMANAQQVVRDALPAAEVVLSNAEDGVAKKLEELLL